MERKKIQSQSSGDSSVQATTDHHESQDSDFLIVPSPWYQHISSYIAHSSITWYIVSLVLLFVGVSVGRWVLNPTYQRTKAGTNTARLGLHPASLALAPSGEVQLWVTADNPVGFVDAELTFEPTLVKLESEVMIVSSQLSRRVKVTSMAEANTTGRISIVLALDPSMRANPPTGTLQLATFTMKAFTSENMTTPMSVDLTTSQIVNPDASLFTVTGENVLFTLNPTPTPTQTIAPTVTSTPVATRTPSPTPAAAETNPPTVSITSPAGGTVIKNSSVSISATATDNVRVTKVVFLVNNKTICTVLTGPYTCAWRPSGRSGATSTLSVQAYDPSGNVGTASVNVTIQ